MTKIEIAKSIVYGLYIFVVFHLVFISGNDHRHLNSFGYSNSLGLYPFRDKMNYFTTLGFTRLYDSKFFLKEVVGNLLLLSPITLIGMLGEGYKKGNKIVLTAFLTSLFIETTQYLSGIGHADIDDLILNTAGAWLAIPFAKWLRTKKVWLQLDEIGGISANYNHP